MYLVLLVHLVSPGAAVTVVSALGFNSLVLELEIKSRELVYGVLLYVLVLPIRRAVVLVVLTELTITELALRFVVFI